MLVKKYNKKGLFEKLFHLFMSRVTHHQEQKREMSPRQNLKDHMYKSPEKRKNFNSTLN